ncbi:MAG: tetratricopeptide repeat protein [Candidatus Binataceae bacterium]
MATHHKLRRKDLKQPDEFQSFFENAGEFLLDNLAAVIIAAAAVIILVGIGFGVYFFWQHQNRLVGEKFYQALTALEGKDYKSAETDFQALAKDRPHQKLGRLAQFYLGNTYLADGKPAQARDALMAYLATAQHPVFENLARTQLAVAYEELGDFKQAQKSYSAAAAIPGPRQTQAELSNARMLVRIGNKQGAIDAYQKFLKDNPFSRERSEVVDDLAQLGVAASQAAPPSITMHATPVAVPHAAASSPNRSPASAPNLAVEGAAGRAGPVAPMPAVPVAPTPLHKWLPP